jgi:hypothetical protein
MPLGAFKAALMGTAGVSTADVVLLSSQTASGASTISFTSGITSTYGEYIFKWYNVNPGTDETHLQVNFSTDGGSNYNMTKTTTAFLAAIRENDSGASLAYNAASDLAQSTGVQKLSGTIGNGSDESAAGELHLFNPSSTTYVKHFLATSHEVEAADYSQNWFYGGYINSTNDVDAVQFSVSSGTFDGKIKMWGVK